MSLHQERLTKTPAISGWINRLLRIHWYHLVVLMICFTLTAFVAYKSAVASFTHDESLSFTRYVPLPVMDILTYTPPFTNNHILNTILMKYSARIFGVSEFSLRLPNVLGMLIYLYFSYRTVSIGKAGRRYASSLLFIPMVANPYLIDFFGCARGYGLSVSFMMLSLFYLIRYVERGSQRDIILFNAGSLLAILSNFALVNYYLSALIALNVLIYTDNKFRIQGESLLKYFLKSNKTNLVFILLDTIIFYVPFRKIMQGNMINFGGKEGFIQDTVLSLVRKSSYDEWPSRFMEIFLMISIIAISTGLFFYFLINLRKVKYLIKAFNHLFIVNTILILVAISTILQHFIFGTDYLMERFGLFLIPLFLLTFVMWLKHWIVHTRSMAPIYSALVLVVFSCHNLFSNLNVRYYIDWKYDVDTKRVVQALSAHYLANLNGEENVKCGVNWLFEPAVNFYRDLYDLQWLAPADREGWNPDDDFHYIFQWDADMASVEDRIIFRGLESVLLARSSPLQISK